MAGGLEEGYYVYEWIGASSLLATYPFSVKLSVENPRVILQGQASWEVGGLITGCGLYDKIALGIEFSSCSGRVREGGGEEGNT